MDEGFIEVEHQALPSGVLFPATREQILWFDLI